MKAIVYDQYGSPDVLRLQEIAQPVPGYNEVLVKVHAASVNYADLSFVTGKPFVVRFMGAGLRAPQNPIMGSDIAGRVEAVGRGVTEFRLGDTVFGDISDRGWGGFAEYVTVSAEALALKPANMSFVQAAAVPQAATTALQGLRDVGQIQPGQKVLINGASGGIGTFAVQLAKSFGAEVTGVCSTRNVDLVRSLGADRVIDYTQEDFAQDEARYDLILAAAGYRSLFDYRRALRPGGTYVASGGAMKQVFQGLLLGPWLSMAGSQKMRSLSAKPSREDLAFIGSLIEASKVVPVIDRCYPLAEVGEALRYYGQGHARGKVVITVAPEGA